jgi:hypothetical protein
VSDQRPSNQIADPWKREKVWLEALKTGDEVASSYGWNGHHIETVTHATSTQIVVGNARFRRKDGYRVGDTGFRRAKIYEPTEEVREEIERFELVRTLEIVSWKKLPIETLRAVAEQVKK